MSLQAVMFAGARKTLGFRVAASQFLLPNGAEWGFVTAE